MQTIENGTTTLYAYNIAGQRVASDAYHFALLDRDADDTHHAQFRQYSSTQGRRWIQGTSA
ncbi:MAG: hypothetical protein JST61_16325, partial [Acidobacteria bacterium]|nr:hypothetical protein [Acidobacteriota bacterium]